MYLGVTTLIRSMPSHCWPQHFHLWTDKRAQAWPSPFTMSFTLTPVLGLWKSLWALLFLLWLRFQSCRHKLSSTRPSSQLIPDKAPPGQLHLPPPAIYILTWHYECFCMFLVIFFFHSPGSHLHCYQKKFQKEDRRQGHFHSSNTVPCANTQGSSM